MGTYTKSEIEFLRENALKYGAFVCSQKLNRKFSSVLSKLKRDGIPYAYKKTDKTQEEINNLSFIDKSRFLDYNFDTNSFPKQLAYFLGFLWADGAINRDSSVIIEIIKKDGDELKDIFLKLCDFKIAYRSRIGRQEQVSFYYKDDNFVRFLKSMGKYSHSSETHEKILSYVPKEYRIYFLRGLSDGDGCFYLGEDKRRKNGHYGQFSITSTYEQDWSGIKSLLLNYGVESIDKKRIHVKTNSSSSALRVTGNKNIKQLVLTLYGDKDGIFLKRKYEVAMNIINTLESEENAIKEKRNTYEVYKDGIFIETFNMTIKEYCEKNNFCYGNFARLSTHPNKKWRGYQIRRI